MPTFVNKNGPVEVYESDQFHLIHTKLYCNNNASKYSLMPTDISNADNFGVSEDGWLLNHLKTKSAAPGQFCIDRFFGNEFQIIAITCEIPSSETGLRIHYIVAMIVSVPFLLVTFLVYAFFKKLRNLHGKSLMCHIAALLVAYLSLIIIQFISNEIENDICILIGK